MTVRISIPQANAAPTLVISSHGREESETYTGIVAALNPSLRVIRGRCGLQWILQSRKSASRWNSIAFCGTKTGLILRIKEHLRQTHHKKERELVPLETLVELHCDAAAWAIIGGLPDYFPK